MKKLPKLLFRTALLSIMNLSKILFIIICVPGLSLYLLPDAKAVPSLVVFPAKPTPDILPIPDGDFTDDQEFAFQHVWNNTSEMPVDVTLNYTLAEDDPFFDDLFSFAQNFALPPFASNFPVTATSTLTAAELNSAIDFPELGELEFILKQDPTFTYSFPELIDPTPPVAEELENRLAFKWIPRDTFGRFSPFINTEMTLSEIFELPSFLDLTYDPLNNHSTIFAREEYNLLLEDQGEQFPGKLLLEYTGESIWKQAQGLVGEGGLRLFSTSEPSVAGILEIPGSRYDRSSIFGKWHLSLILKGEFIDDKLRIKTEMTIGRFFSPPGTPAILFLDVPFQEAPIPIHGEITGIAEQVPEPLTILGTATAVGFGAFFKRQINKKKRDNEE